MKIITYAYNSIYIYMGDLFYWCPGSWLASSTQHHYGTSAWSCESYTAFTMPRQKKIMAGTR